MGAQDSVSSRVAKAAQALSVSSTALLKVLVDEGVSDNDAGLMLLNSPSLTVDDIAAILKGKILESESGQVGNEIKAIPAKAAAGILKQRVAPETPAFEVRDKDGVSLFRVDAETRSAKSDIATLAQVLRPIQQWEDKDVLQNFIDTRSAEAEAELDRRAKSQRFVVLMDPATKNLKRYEPGKEEIDAEMSLKLLRDSRKRQTPKILPMPGRVANVYRITELNPQDRIVEICPICGETLYEGYCEKCGVTFIDVADEARAYVWLVANTPGSIRADSVSDRKAVMASAAKGVDDLKVTWPSLAQKFEDMLLTSSLPKLRVIQNRPSTTVADPYHVEGNRTFGNRSF